MFFYTKKGFFEVKNEKNCVFLFLFVFGKIYYQLSQYNSPPLEGWIASARRGGFVPDVRKNENTGIPPSSPLVTLPHGGRIILQHGRGIIIF